MKVYTVRFRVGSDKRIVETAFFGEPPAKDELRQKVAARGIEAPRQFPASAVHLVSVSVRMV